MKVKVEIRKISIFKGELELNEERYELYKTLEDMDLISRLLMKGLSHDESWSVSHFDKIKSIPNES